MSLHVDLIFQASITYAQLQWRTGQCGRREKKAFVSFIRAYKKHECSHIFIWRELEVGKLAMGYGLLHLPSISKLKQHRLYSDGTNLGRNKDSRTYKKGDRNGKKKRKEGKARKGRKMHMLLMIPPKKLTGKQRQTIQTAEDEEEMALEYRLLRKPKKRLITEDEYLKITDLIL
ncbi:unnamed protein product [Brassica oleracea var. botrytis]